MELCLCLRPSQNCAAECARIWKENPNYLAYGSPEDLKLDEMWKHMWKIRSTIHRQYVSDPAKAEAKRLKANVDSRRTTVRIRCAQPAATNSIHVCYR